MSKIYKALINPTNNNDCFNSQNIHSEVVEDYIINEMENLSENEDITTTNMNSSSQLIVNVLSNFLKTSLSYVNVSKRM